MMKYNDADPRILRTRKLIMDSFFDLSWEKEFKDITVKDITTKAAINRSTFYYHFVDKYELLESSLSEVFLINLNSNLYEKNELNDETLIKIFTALTDFHKSLPTRCHTNNEDTVALFIREQLKIIFYKLLIKVNKFKEDESLKTTAVILSWGIYGASVEWIRNCQNLSPEKYIKSAIPYLISGINTNSKNQ